MADFRPIAPALQSEHSSTSSANQRDHPSDTPGTSIGGLSGLGSGVGSGSGGGDGGGDGGRRGRGPPGDAGQRRRRLPGHVAVLACNECRRARAKVRMPLRTIATVAIARGLTTLVFPSP